MAYRVRLTAPAEADAYSAYEYIRELSPQRAERWLNELFRAISSLAEMPGRCAVIPETEEIGREIRHLPYGKRSGVYRIIFDVQDGAEDGPQVRVLRIRHGAQDKIMVEDLEEV